MDKMYNIENMLKELVPKFKHCSSEQSTTNQQSPSMYPANNPGYGV